MNAAPLPIELRQHNLLPTRANPFPEQICMFWLQKKTSLQAGKCSRIPRVFPAVPGVFPVVPGVFPAVSWVVPGVFPYLLLGMFQVLARQAIKTFEDFHATRTKSRQPIFQMLQIHNRQTSRFLYQIAKLFVCDLSFVFFLHRNSNF